MTTCSATGESTPLLALRELDIMRLGARIFDLRGLGVEVNDELVTYENERGERKRYKEYWLPSEVKNNGGKENYGAE